MKNMLALLVGAILLTGSASAQTADAAGTWDVSVNTPNGPIAALLVLKKDGEKLTGSIAGAQGEAVVEGTQKDKAVSVNFTVQTSNGPMAIAMTGTQDGDAIAGTTTVGEWSGKRRTGAPGGAATNGAGQTDKPVDVSGAWALQLDIGGNTVTPGVTFKQDGDKLTGTYSSQMLGEQPLTGTVKGNDITFGFQASFDGNAVKVTYTGKVDKDTMKGSVAFGDLGEGTFTGKKK
jgi:hypothetical protein